MDEGSSPNNNVHDGGTSATDKIYIKESLEEFAQILYEYQVKVLSINEKKE